MDPPPVPTVNLSPIHDPAELKLDQVPYTKADLILAGTRIPVKLSLKRNGTELHFLLWASEQQVEEEVYDLTPAQLALINASGEAFSPPIPLLMFPLSPGREWDWSGTMMSGPTKRLATGTIQTQAANLNIVGGPYETVLVKLKLSMDGGGATPAERELSFWFARGAGLVKREFGSSSTREPASE